MKKELKYVINVVTPYASLNKATINFITNSEDVYILGERQKLHQCIINLVKNGIESLVNGGDVFIELMETTSEAIIYIQDNGSGMNEEQINRLGTPYYSTEEKGTGIGTMVVYSIIKVMHGSIEVDSELGEGTCIVCIFPFKYRVNQHRLTFW